MDGFFSNDIAVPGRPGESIDVIGSRYGDIGDHVSSSKSAFA